ncbi:hypothetical protein QWM81_12770 [Streptomyces ficellus]|uniref:Uncharacterized protein n=1 Tax=Streptomyces ficellus TaxID=1977088 RepID=A0ABT7Z5X7_9ACTN|nr:hypothetical protein [Streptomyces ficellus]MDN3294909.1 hypothetical protein [Streptomyces ficellus]
MISQAVRPTGLTLDPETLEGLMTQAEAPLSDAPAPLQADARGAGLIALALIKNLPRKEADRR